MSATTHLAVMGEGNIAVGQSNSTSFLRPVTAGHVHAEAHRRSTGAAPRGSGTCDFTDDEGRLCAASARDAGRQAGRQAA